MRTIILILALCALSFYANATAHTVKIKLLTSGAKAFRFVEIDSQTNLPVGIGSIECNWTEPLYFQVVTSSQANTQRSSRISNYNFTHNVDCENWLQNSTAILRDYYAELSWSENNILHLSFLDEPLDRDTQRTAELTRKLRSSYRAPKITKAPMLYHTGSKTEYVHIYIHGLFMDQDQFRNNAEYSFTKGINSIVTVLPGHESNSYDDLNLYNENDWISHANDLVEIAKSMGEKVIVFGHSAGGLIGFNLGLEKKVDGVVLIQPSFGLTFKTSMASLFGGLGKLFVKTSLAPVGGRMVSRLISKTLNCKQYDGSFRCDGPSNYEVPTLVFTDPLDDVVNTQATLETMGSLKNAKIKFINHNNGHMHIPNLKEIKLLESH